MAVLCTHPRGERAGSCMYATWLPALRVRLVGLRALYLRRSQETLIGLAQPRISEEKKSGIFMIQWARWLQQVHADILKISVTLATITGTAACDQVLPGTLASPRARNHMVERQLTRSLAAILAGIF